MIRTKYKMLLFLLCLNVVFYQLVVYLMPRHHSGQEHNQRARNRDTLYDRRDIYPLEQLKLEDEPDSSRNKILYLRYEHQLRHCKGLENLQSNVSERLVRRHLQKNEKHKIMYCVIEKAGSTFWRRLFQLLNKGVVRSPYDIKPEHVLENHVDIRKTPLVKLLGLLKSSTKFTFVRNPYTRLLSGFVDKIYSPNPYYWQIGALASKHARKEDTCGHDTTFKEFVEYLTDSFNKVQIDEHFIPGHDLCIPCQTQYHYIGKIETFIPDTFYILNKLNFSEYFPFLNGLKEKSVSDAIYDASQAFVKFRKDASRCLSYNESLKRIWRKLQIRGIIANEIQFSVSVNDSRIIKVEALSKILKDAHDQSKKYDLNSQKRQHFIDAYRTIPLTTMYRLADMYKLDFKIFDYEMFPSDLFNTSSLPTSDVFSVDQL